MDVALREKVWLRTVAEHDRCWEEIMETSLVEVMTALRRRPESIPEPPYLSDPRQQRTTTCSASTPLSHGCNDRWPGQRRVVWHLQSPKRGSHARMALVLI